MTKKCKGNTFPHPHHHVSSFFPSGFYFLTLMIIIKGNRILILIASFCIQIHYTTCNRTANVISTKCNFRWLNCESHLSLSITVLLVGVSCVWHVMCLNWFSELLTLNWLGRRGKLSCHLNRTGQQGCIHNRYFPFPRNNAHLFVVYVMACHKKVKKKNEANQ